MNNEIIQPSPQAQINVLMEELNIANQNRWYLLALVRTKREEHEAEVASLLAEIKELRTVDSDSNDS